MPQPPKQLDASASPREWFGAELRHWRKNVAGLSLQQLAAKAHVSREVIRRIEVGDYNCRLETAIALDRALNTGGFLERGWGHAFGDNKSHRDDNFRAAAPSPGAVTPLRGRMLATQAPTAQGSNEPVDRRSFLAVPGLAALAATPGASRLLSPAQPTQLPAEIRPHDIQELIEAATFLSRLDHQYGGDGIVKQTASTAMMWAEDLLHISCPPALRQGLFAAVAHLGIVVGASNFDALAHQDARQTFRFAAACAEEAKEWHLRAKTYSLLARQAIWTNEPDDGLTFAELGLARADRLTATERAMLHAARARAFARMGEVQQTLSAVGEADDAFAHARPDEDPPWMAYYDEAQHNGDTAHALYDLALHGHDPTRAARRLSAAVKGHGDRYARSRVLSRTKLASLVMATGDPNHAADIGHQALSEAGHLHSRRAAADIRELGRLAGKHPTNGNATSLRERVTATVPV
ncbi:helix-turn-helix transcriptional regulator [Streptomyces aidingensis]|uniref:Helix-turn-helix domain-containing protein n=1 Tax=Streptomyces aidingensis TaxID=910347 RepID=A0A1I1S8X8_9ACTN|nr:helix-turn-helix transcriptional regulator [Streptomyces aidingensis]SFD42857.1 Helix-turn-helix domain-containing protein [Streptomyces aidingensis]